MYLNSNNNVLYVGKYLNSTNLIVFAPIKINFNFTWFDANFRWS